ncbi:hypothetical protein Fmac_031524 [Flemingia macrophylla]|uniref:Uncharacterized protein n=1 Tax=Flemingia macrophylla TaxID=520843 RepID=A0ABD1L2T6_9FABA
MKMCQNLVSNCFFENCSTSLGFDLVSSSANKFGVNYLLWEEPISHITHLFCAISLIF